MNVKSLYCLVILFLIMWISQAVKTPKQKKRDEDVEVITRSDLDEKVEEMNRRTNKEKGKEDKKQADEVKKLEADAKSFAKKAELAKEGFGEFSEERAKMIHSLGRTVYKLGKFAEALAHSKQIVHIYEQMYGVNALETSAALGNVASVSYKLKDMVTCELTMLRALYIILNEFKNKGGEGSKEVLMHRAKMMTFGLKTGETSKGISYEEYNAQVGLGENAEF